MIPKSMQVDRGKQVITNRRRFRLTIGAMMGWIAAMAGVFVICRTVGFGPGTVLGLSCTAGWVAWSIGRWRPGAALYGLGVVYVLSCSLIVVIPLLRSPRDIIFGGLLIGVSVITLGYPAILGFGSSYLLHLLGLRRLGYRGKYFAEVVIATFVPLPLVILAAKLWLGILINGLPRC